jgi:hypothetical protein
MPAKQGVGYPMKLTGMKSGVSQQHLQGANSRRVVVKSGFDILSNASEK